MPDDWYACVQFSLVMWNPSEPSIYVSSTTQHRFNAKEGDWGFTRFVELRKAFQQQWEQRERPLVENDEVKITAFVRVYKDPTGVLWHNFEGYDSKKETGMVGLKNQGATCYLNSLLQSLYFTNAFRKAIYQIPTESDPVKTNSSWTLQRLFYNLQKHKSALSTSELTASLGWDSGLIFEQQDIQELSRILMDKMEERMKGTSAQNALANLFVGKSKTYISCINVEFESSRIEDFWDIQLNVRGYSTLHESFVDYIQVETLEGENKYDAGEPYNLQDAKKGVIFESFPPVLHLQLKRFEYDVNRGALMKINDRQEFPLEFDAAQYLSDEADRSESWVYQLHGVLVHSGCLNAGHYYAFLKPEKDGCFYKFDDDRVTRSTLKETLDENFGGEYASVANGGLGQRQPYTRGFSTTRSMSAYMLVYIRKTRLDQVLVQVMEEDIPSHIERKLVEERAELERRKKERDEAHFYLTVGLITDVSFKHHHGFDLIDWDAPLGDPAAALQQRVLRVTKIADFAKQIADERDLASEQVRFWVMVRRRNHTIRPDQPIRDPDMTIEEAWNEYGTRGAPFRLWVEICELADGKPSWPEANPNSPVPAPTLIFLKYFDIERQTLNGVGHLYVNGHVKVADIATDIQQLMGWDSETTFSLYEEIKHTLIEPLKPRQTFQQSEIQDGDIICIQKTQALQDSKPVIYQNAKQYYEYLRNRMSVAFQPRTPAGTDGETFTLSLSKEMSYEQFSAKVADHLKVAQTHIRLGTVHSTTGKLKAWVKRTLNQNLEQIMSSSYSNYGYASHKTDALFYEVLETSLADFETKKLLKINWLPEGISREVCLEYRSRRRWARHYSAKDGRLKLTFSRNLSNYLSRRTGQLWML
jgi:ubiquitin carboxyl-terminal hydrolase 7